MKSQMKMIGLGMFAAASVFAVAAQGLKLVRKPVAGTETKYRLKANLELGGQEIVFNGAIAEKVVEVAADGSYTLENRTLEGKVSVAGQEIDVPAGTTPSISVFTPNGLIKELRGDAVESSAYRSANLSSTYFPDKEVKVGDEWTYDAKADTKTGAVSTKSTYKIAGEEKVGAFDTFRITFTTKEAEGSEPASSEGTVWIDKADGSMVKTDAKWANFPFPGAPAPVNGTVSVTRD